jgi:DNA polymerase-1
MELNLVTNLTDGLFEKFKFDLESSSNPIGLDTETSGLDCFTVTWYLLQIFLDGNTYLFDCQSLGKDALIVIIDSIIASKRLVIMHNAKFDIKIIKVGVNRLLTKVHDTMWTETLIYLGVGDVLHSLASLVKKYTGVELDKSERHNFYENYTGLTQELLVYSALDVVYLLEIYKGQMKLIEERKLKRVYKLESDLVPVIAMMEYHGVLIDVPKWTAMANANKIKLDQARIDLENLLLGSIDYTKYESALNAFEDLLIKDKVKTKKARLAFSMITSQDEIKALVRQEFNFGSNQQMQRLLNLLGVDIASTNAKILKDKRSQYDFVDKILEFREFEKKESTYGLSFLNHINPVTGRIHTEFLNLGARTGRFSSGDSSNGKGKPNLQNIPKGSDYRSCFISRPGKSLLAVDYSQQEYRLVGAVSNEPVIIQAYIDGIDMHTATAMIVTGKTKDEITKADRSLGKSVNFAIIYGSSEYGLARNLKINVDEGKRILDDFYAGYPVLKAFKSAAEKIILEKKYSITPYGRRRYFRDEPDFADSKELMKYRNSIAREGFNMIIQGGGADITKLALVKLFYENPFGDKFQLQIQVHDEIVAEVDDTIKAEAKIWMENIMKEVEQPFLGRIPAEVEGAMDTYWVH